MEVICGSLSAHRGSLAQRGEAPDLSLHSRRETGLGWEPAPLGVSDTHQVTIPVVLNEGFDCLQAGNVPAFPPWVSRPPVGGAEMVQGLGLLCDLGEVCFPFWAPMLGMGLCGQQTRRGLLLWLGDGPHL